MTNPPCGKPWLQPAAGRPATWAIPSEDRPPPENLRSAVLREAANSSPWAGPSALFSFQLLDDPEREVISFFPLPREEDRDPGGRTDWIRWQRWHQSSGGQTQFPDPRTRPSGEVTQYQDIIKIFQLTPSAHSAVLVQKLRTVLGLRIEPPA